MALQNNSHLETPAPDSCRHGHVRLEHHEPLIVPPSLTVGGERGGCPVVDHRTDPECLAGVEIKCRRHQSKPFSNTLSKSPIKCSQCAGKLGAPVGIDSCHGQRGRLARRSLVLASGVVGLCNTGLWPDPRTCPLSFARRPNRLLDPARQKFGDSTRVSETERETAQNALWTAMALMWLPTRHPGCFDRSCGLWTRLRTITASARASHLELVRPIVAYQVRQRRRRC